MSQLGRSKGSRPDGYVAALNGELYQFLRNSHIFSSAVREILETKYLADTCSESLTLQQFHLLKLISLNGNHHVGEIADFLGVSSPAASKNIDKLERLGLVSRAQCTTDRRATLLTATQKARQLVQRYEDHKAERLTPVLQRFRTGELEELTRLLERFSVLLYAKEAPAESFCLRCAAYGQEDCPIGRVLGNCPYAKVSAREKESDGSGSRGNRLREETS
jgi:DNA-binding MarR family transcriptional regulator